jgi:enoyl-ACP reductase-like protein
MGTSVGLPLTGRSRAGAGPERHRPATGGRGHLGLQRGPGRPARPDPRLGPLDITVNLVAPGWIPVERHAGVDPRHVEDYRRDVPLGRMGTPAEIADVVTFLASGAARFVNSERITVNGGHAMD